MRLEDPSGCIIRLVDLPDLNHPTLDEDEGGMIDAVRVECVCPVCKGPTYWIVERADGEYSKMIASVVVDESWPCDRCEAKARAPTAGR
jgi:hypothetical protein